MPVQISSIIKSGLPVQFFQILFCLHEVVMFLTGKFTLNDECTLEVLSSIVSMVNNIYHDKLPHMRAIYSKIS